MWIISSLITVKTPTAVALGNFDGLHQGHRQVIQPILDYGDGLGDRPYPTVVTFHPHPREFFTGQPHHLLTPLDEKVEQLQALGLEQLVLLPFDRELARLSPQQFVAEILVNQLQARCVSVGQDFCFGRQRTGTASDLKEIAAGYGIDVAIAPLKTLVGDRISSSAIRQALQDSKIQQANHLLGRPYSLVGQVIQGQQLGRTIGFPTANLQLPASKFLPCYGVYAVQVYRCDTRDGLRRSLTSPLPGVMNLGIRPTVDGLQEAVEVHLLDGYNHNLYGQTLWVDLIQFLRPEQKFGSLDALKTQIQLDCEIASNFLLRDKNKTGIGFENQRESGN